MSTAKIIVVPLFGQGHLFPCIELCKQLASRNLETVLVVLATRSSAIPSDVSRNPLIEVAVMGSLQPPGTEQHAFHQHFHNQMADGIDRLLAEALEGPAPLFAVLDDKMGWCKAIFAKHSVPVVTFFTSGACSAAVEHGAWKSNARDLKPGQVQTLTGLPDNMSLTHLDLKRRPHPRGPPPPIKDGGGHGPPGWARRQPGGPPGWLGAMDGSIGLLINTCNEFEGPFIDYIANQIAKKPAWAVGPLLPDEYWRANNPTPPRDGEVRPGHRSSHTEEQVTQWLGSKPRQSVLYVSFGSEVGPTPEEYPRIAAALGESTRPFLWVIQPGAGGGGGAGNAFFGIEPAEEGYFPHALAESVGERGLIVRGWAPQILILSHGSTGGFLSHCGWNSMLEAMGRGVPLLGWPLRGDQYYNAKLAAHHLGVGYLVSDGDLSEMIGKDDVAKGIERLMTDEGAKKRAAALSAALGDGFPARSAASLDSFGDFILNLKSSH